MGRPVLRPVGESDTAFLRELYLDVHAAEFALMPLDPAGLTILAELQLRAQHASYAARYPRSQDCVVELAGSPVGRCWINQAATELRVLDIAVLAAHRRRGIAGQVLAELQSEAGKLGCPLQLAVWRDNTAAAELYGRLGFTVTAEADGYRQLSWAPAL